MQRLQSALEKNRALAEELAGAFKRAHQEMKSFFQDLGEMSMPTMDFSSGAAGVTENPGGMSLPFSLDFTKATQDLNAFFKAAGKTLKLNADASGVISAGKSALSELQSLYSSTTLTLTAEVEESGGGDSGGTASSGGTVRAATGGRFTTPTLTEIAEDGDPEYVIPVRKESLAVPLLRQVIGELSVSAREALQVGDAGSTGMAERRDALSGLPDFLSSAASAAAPVIHQNTSQNVSAPVSIQVTAPASDPEAVGRSVYNVAEQYLLRTLKTAIL